MKDNNLRKSSFVAEIKSLIVLIAIVLLIRILVVEPFHVPTSSMQATILPGEYLFSTKYSYGYSKYSMPFSPDLFSGRIFAAMPERGDIIIMRPPHKMETRYIKRLIGLPGDKVEMRKNITYINDVALERLKIGTYIDDENKEYVKYKETFPNGGLSFYTYKRAIYDEDQEGNRGNFGPYIVPDDHFFFIGDNRDDSGDSRYQLGFVPFENLISKAQFVFLSIREPLWKPELGFTEQIARVWTWLGSIRPDRLFVNLYSL